jgi:hypothetical protein
VLVDPHVSAHTYFKQTIVLSIIVFENDVILLSRASTCLLRLISEPHMSVVGVKDFRRASNLDVETGRLQTALCTVASKVPVVRHSMYIEFFM